MFVGGVDVGHDPVAGRGDQPGRGNLGRRIQRAEIAGEPAHRAQPDRPPHGCPVRRLLGPVQGVADRQVLGAGGVQVGHELLEHPGLVGQLVAHHPADGQVVRYGRAEVGHRWLPGQGGASSRSAR